MHPIQVLSAAGTLNPGDAAVWTGAQPDDGIFEARAIATDGERAHCFLLGTATPTAPAFAMALLSPVLRKFAAGATAGQRLAETPTGLRPFQPGEAVTAIALETAMAGDSKLVAQLPASLPRWQRWTGRAGTGLPETIAHNLGGVPDRVFILVEGETGLTWTALQGSHTATDLIVTVSIGVTYGIFADRLA